MVTDQACWPCNIGVIANWLLDYADIRKLLVQLKVSNEHTVMRLLQMVFISRDLMD
jgi:hypothetical protein